MSIYNKVLVSYSPRSQVHVMKWELKRKKKKKKKERKQKHWKQRTERREQSVGEGKKNFTEAKQVHANVFPEMQFEQFWMRLLYWLPLFVVLLDVWGTVHSARALKHGFVHAPHAVLIWGFAPFAYRHSNYNGTEKILLMTMMMYDANIMLMGL